MKCLIFAAYLAILIAGTANADSLKGNYGACVSEDLFDQFVTASTRDDHKAFSYLLQNGCILTKPGISVSVLETTWTGKAKVRAYVGDTSVVLWTFKENLVSE